MWLLKTAPSPPFFVISIDSTMMRNNQIILTLSILTLVLLQNVTADLDNGGFVRTSGTHFAVNGRPLYTNGFNAYWFMYQASDPSDKSKVYETLDDASRLGVNLIRTWAFSDGGYRPLQVSPGSYNEQMFKGLDLVISEAKKRGIYLILTLVNNWEGFGGKKQYVQWARDQGHYLNSDDDFFTDNVVKGYYKNHIKAVLTRVNTVTGVAYKDDPTIFAWELMNEPRCQNDLSGQILQAWISEMAAEVKAIDGNHLLTIGLEGFYGESVPEKKQFNPGYEVGTDFISNHQIHEVDFATIHAYPDQWISGSNDETQLEFVKKWIESHIQDSSDVLKKPLIVTEFGKSSRSSGYNVGVRDSYLRAIYDAIYESARLGGPCAGGLFWHVMAQGMEGWSDGYEVFFAQSPSTASVISQQSTRMANLNVRYVRNRRLQELLLADE